MNSSWLGIFLGLLIAGFIALLIYFAKKNEIFKIVLISLLCAGYLGLTSYCVVQLNIYYSAKGGIFGKLSEVVAPSVNVDDDLKFEFKNVCLTQDLDSDTYSLRLYCDDKVELDSSKKYGLYVNDNPINMIESKSNLLFGDYRYLFYGENNQLLLDDTLHIRFVFNSNNSYLNVSSDGGSVASKLWNYYFKNNNFVISLKEDSYIFAQSTAIIPQKYNVSVFLGDDYLYGGIYNEGQKVVLRNLVGVDHYEDGEGNVITSNSIVNSNMQIYVVLQEEEFLSAGSYSTYSGYVVAGGSSSNTGILVSKYDGYDENDNPIVQHKYVDLDSYGWNSYSVEGSYIYMESIYQEFDSVCVDVENLECYVVDLNYDNGIVVQNYIVYSNNNLQGIYLYDVATGSSSQIYSTGVWTSFQTRFNEFTGFRSKVRITNSGNVGIEYDVITGSLSTYDTSSDVSI